MIKLLPFVDVLSLIDQISIDEADDNVIPFPKSTKPSGQESRTVQALNTQQSQISKGNVAAESKIYEKILQELLKYSK